MNQQEREQLSKELHRAYEIIDEVLEHIEQPHRVQLQRDVLRVEMIELRELVGQLWQDFKLTMEPIELSSNGDDSGEIPSE